MIRSFEDSAVVEALFDVGGQEKLQREILEMGFVDGEDLVVRRVVSRSGKNRVYINGALAPLSSLAALGESLINICGQHEHQLILNPESHTDVLDEFGELLTLRSAYREAYDRYRSLNERRRALEELRRKKEEREDLLRFQIGEISGACVRAGEDAALAEEKKVLANVQRLMDFASAAYETLYGKSGSVLAELRGAAAAVKEIRKIDASLGVAGDDLDEIYYRIEDAAFVLRDYQKRLSFEPARLEEVEERLELLGRLKRKYGGTLETVLKRQAEAEGELANIASLEEETEVLTREIAREKERVLKAAGDLSVKRRAAAAALEAAVEAEIRTLRMADARFAVVFRDLPAGGGEEQLNEKGADDLEFYLSANVGEEMKPLRGIASGGELSRIMLALKKVLARTGSVGTIVFDEVDSGIGGATAEIVGQKLREVSRHHQILCITHLPQIACCGDRHYLVAKRVAGERTNTSVVLLAEEGRQEEIARMLGGVEMTEKTREHAREMLVAARG